MKNQFQQHWQLQPNTTQYLLYKQLVKIKALKTKSISKINIITGMIFLLKQKEQSDKLKCHQNISTLFSEKQNNFTMYQRDIEDLEDRILQKRAIKFQINEEIQNIQEDLFETQKTVDSKKQYDQFLRKQIQNKIKNTQRREELPQQHRQSYLNQSFKAVSGIFKGCFS